jgi:peptide/nickel transport system ATP-binding protein
LKNNTALKVENLKVDFTGEKNFSALRNVSFIIAAGKTLALLGESGSGKSVTSLAIMGLLGTNVAIEGTIKLLGEDKNLIKATNKEWAQIRGKKIGMIFQEPMSALNPVKTCGYQLIESIQTHQSISTKQARLSAIDWLKKVKLPEPEQLLKKYPHQLSGGQKQRLMIAMAMCNNPALLIADEPTTALDVSVQRDILLLMKALQQEYDTAILFITHDLDVASFIADSIIHMKQGEIVTEEPHTIITTKKEEKKINLQLPLLLVQKVSIRYPLKSNFCGKNVHYYEAVKEVSFELFKGETVSLIGESGSGKSTLGRSLLGLQKIYKGNVYIDNQLINWNNSKDIRLLKKKIQIIFQDPFSSLNQRLSIGDTLAEPLLVHGITDKKHVEKYVEKLLNSVALPATAAKKYPHEFSGGQRQRIGIARALAVSPELIICDEIVAALDTKIQDQVLQLLRYIQEERKVTYLFITHDLKVAEKISDRIMIMYNGEIIEKNTTELILNKPEKEYTKHLLKNSF